MVDRAERIRELETRITATETVLARLKAELTAERQRAQHDEVDNLENHLTQATVSLSDVRAFIDVVLAEFRGLRGNEKR